MYRIYICLRDDAHDQVVRNHKMTLSTLMVHPLPLWAPDFRWTQEKMVAFSTGHYMTELWQKIQCLHFYDTQPQGLHVQKRKMMEENLQRIHGQTSLCSHNEERFSKGEWDVAVSTSNNANLKQPQRLPMAPILNTDIKGVNNYAVRYSELNNGAQRRSVRLHLPL